MFNTDKIKAAVTTMDACSRCGWEVKKIIDIR